MEQIKDKIRSKETKSFSFIEDFTLCKMVLFVNNYELNSDECFYQHAFFIKIYLPDF